MTKIVAAFARPSTGRTELSASGMVWLQNAILSEFESPHRSGGGRPPVDSRGVAQPGRAPGSGPGGRRFKSSLPDQFLQAVRAISAPAVLGAMGATGNFGATVGVWKPSPTCSAVNLRNSTSSFTFE
jgi:hypothetical protein